jgi:hypothetical protein
VSLVDTGVVAPLALERENTAATGLVVDESGMDGRATNERVGAVIRIFERSLVVGRTPNDQWFVAYLLVANGVRVQDLDALAVGGAAKGHGIGVEGATEVTIETAAISVVPGPY